MDCYEREYFEYILRKQQKRDKQTQIKINKYNNNDKFKKVKNIKG